LNVWRGRFTTPKNFFTSGDSIVIIGHHQHALCSNTSSPLPLSSPLPWLLNRFVKF
jgi:hypothetical protein